MAPVKMNPVFFCCNPAGFPVAGSASGAGLGIGADQAAEGGKLLGVGKNFFVLFVEQGNVDTGEGIEVLEKRTQFFEIKG